MAGRLCSIPLTLDSVNDYRPKAGKLNMPDQNRLNKRSQKILEKLIYISSNKFNQNNGEKMSKSPKYK